MSAYYVDFSGWCKVEADSESEAKAKFWEYIYYDEPLPLNNYNLEGIEKVEETTD